jgi:hypothetical protein
MSASRPEADTEYSRGHRGSGRPAGAAAGPPARVSRGLVAGAALGAALLVVAEFMPLLKVHSSAYRAGTVATIQTGSHHSYALIPIAFLTLVLALAARTGARRPAMAAIGALALVTVMLVVLRDLPDVHVSGVTRVAGHLASETTSAATGLYVETLGAVVLLLTSAAGLLLAPTSGQVRRRVPGRSAS